LASEAALFLRRRPVVIESRKQWPDRSRITAEQRVEDGRALSRWGDGGWGELVKRGKGVDGRFDQRLVDALADLVRGWRPEPGPEWLAWTPSMTHPNLVPDLAHRLAAALDMPALEAIIKTRPTAPQKTMQNSTQQLANIKDAFSVTDQTLSAPVLLIDDIV